MVQGNPTPPYVPAAMPVGFRPGAPPPRPPRVIIGKLVFNGIVEADDRYKQKATMVGKSLPQWKIDFEAQDVRRHDGTPARYGNTANLYDRKGNLQGEGSTYHQMWQLFAAAGVDVDPNAQPGLVGHFFRLTETKIGSGNYASTLWVPTGGAPDYFGTTCPPITEIRTLPAPDSPAGGPPIPAEGAAGTAVPTTPANEDALGLTLAQALNGVAKENAAATVVQHPTLRTVQSLFGNPMILGLTGDAPIIQALIDKGLLVESEGVLVCTQTPA